MPPAKFIELLEHAVAVSGDRDQKKDLLTQALQPMTAGRKSELDPHSPLSKEQAKRILELLIRLTDEEVKPSYGKEGRQDLRAKRLAALEAIAQWVDAGAEESKRFAKINRYQVAIQMALRVRRPSSVNQGPQGFCGPAAVLVPCLRDDPSRYVRFVTELFDRGESSLGQQRVNPVGAPDFCNGWEPDSGPAADYIALGSLRACVEALVDARSGGGMVFSFLNNDSHATTPQQMCRLLTDAGYARVQNDALADYTAPRTQAGLRGAMDSLKRCELLLGEGRAGRAVVMLVHPALALAAKRSHPINGDAHVKQLHELHWVLVKRLTLKQDKVEMKLFTWKWSGVCEYALGDFLPRYFGYVSGDPA